VLNLLEFPLVLVVKPMKDLLLHSKVKIYETHHVSSINKPTR
jgi:hypothetical protein